VQWLVWGGLVLTIIGIAVAFLISERAGLRKRNGNDDLRVITQGLPAFTLTNQSGHPVMPRDFSNFVSVVDIVFTRCAGPCPEMTRRMSELQRDIPANLPVKLVTVTTDPEFDTPEVLKRYSERFKANPDRWWFLSGEKSEIARFAREGLKLVALETKPEERQNDADLFIHSTVFVLLDKHGRLRGAIESTEPDFHARVQRAVRRLARER
jgi:cytochrome oxidase Cu insertion factor (SCO1/SenC/PrrC family)